MTEFAGPEGPISKVQPGMTVIDASGQELGTVDDIRMADAGTTTAEGQGSADGGNAFSWLAGAFGFTSGLSRQAQERLARTGYIRVDASGAFSGHRYVEASKITQVSDGEVRLSVDADSLLG